MNILQEILNSNDGKALGQLADQFGLNKEDAAKALSNLVPAIAGGIKKTANSRSGLESLIAKVDANQEVKRAIDQPTVLSNNTVTNVGNDILGDIFGSKEVSRTVAGHTANSTGIDLGKLKQMLPVVAGLVMSGLNKKSEQQSSGGLGDLLGSLTGGQSSGGGLGGLLGGIMASGGSKTSSKGGLEGLLDFDGDGNVADDVLDMARKLF